MNAFIFCFLTNQLMVSALLSILSLMMKSRAANQNLSHESRSDWKEDSDGLTPTWPLCKKQKNNWESGGEAERWRHSRRHHKAEGRKEEWRNMTEAEREAERGDERVWKRANEWRRWDREAASADAISWEGWWKSTYLISNVIHNKKKPLSSKSSYIFSPSEVNKHPLFSPLRSRHSCTGCSYFRLHASWSVVKLFHQAKPQLRYNTINTPTTTEMGSIKNTWHFRHAAGDA